MKKFAPLAILLLVALVYWLISSQPEKGSSQAPHPQGAETSAASPTLETPASIPTAKPRAKGEIKDDLSAQFMVDYGKEELPPSADLMKVTQMLESYFALVKSDTPLPLGENREIAAALIGENPYRTRFLSPNSPWLNAESELTDRWNTPLYFHAISAKKIGVRSAGPDQKMWTPDDLIDGENALPLPK